MAASMIEGTTRFVASFREPDGGSYHGVMRYRALSLVGDQAAAADAVMLAMYNALAADSALQTALRLPTGGSQPRVFYGEAPTGQALNYLVIGGAAEAESEEVTSFDQIGVDTEVTLDAWVIPTAPTATQTPNRHYAVSLIYEHVARVLNAKRLVLA